MAAKKARKKKASRRAPSKRKTRTSPRSGDRAGFGKHLWPGFALDAIHIKHSATRAKEEADAFIARLATFRAEIWALPKDRYSGGMEEKRRVHNTLKVANDHLRQAKKHISSAQSLALQVLRRCK